MKNSGRVLLSILFFTLASCSFVKNHDLQNQPKSQTDQPTQVDQLNKVIQEGSPDEVHNSLTINRSIVNQVNSNGQTPLEAAIRRGQLDIIKDVLATGGSIFASSIEGLSPYDKRDSLNPEIKNIIIENAKKFFSKNIKLAEQKALFDKNLPCSVYLEGYIHASFSERQLYSVSSIQSILDQNNCKNDLSVSMLQGLFFDELFYQKKMLLSSTELLVLLKRLSASSRLLLKVNTPQRIIELTPKAVLLDLSELSQGKAAMFKEKISEITGNDDLIAEVYSNEGILKQNIRLSDLFGSPSSSLIYEDPSTTIESLLKIYAKKDETFWPLDRMQNPHCNELLSFIFSDSKLHQPVIQNSVCAQAKPITQFSCTDKNLQDVQQEIHNQLYDPNFDVKFDLSPQQKLFVENYLTLAALKVSVAGVLVPAKTLLHTTYRQNKIENEVQFVKEVIVSMKVFPSSANKENREATADYIDSFIASANSELSCEK